MTWYTAEHPSNQFVEEKKSIIMSRKQRVSKMAVNVKTKVLMHISIYNLGVLYNHQQRYGTSAWTPGSPLMYNNQYAPYTAVYLVFVHCCILVSFYTSLASFLDSPPARWRQKVPHRVGREPGNEARPSPVPRCPLYSNKYFLLPCRG